jgi:hypothetical protein
MGLVPASAGVVPAPTAWTVGAVACPRTRGGRPTVSTESTEVANSSPHPRG